MTGSNDLRFRPATAADAEAAVPLIRSSGPAAFDYVFGIPERRDAQAFLRHAFIDGAGEFGWRQHVVGELAGEVVAVGAGFDGRQALDFTIAAARQILHFHGVAGFAVIARGLRVERVIRPPGRDMFCLAHLGVWPELRGQGIGTGLIAHLIALGEARGHRRMVLDVAVDNPRAQALYEKNGFKVTAVRSGGLHRDDLVVVDHHRMERLLR